MNATDRAMLGAPGKPLPRVAVIPTASGLEPGMPEVWNARGVKHFERLGAQVTPLLITERAHCFDQANVAALEQADFFYFSGGNPNYVVETWRDTPAWAALLARWRAGAVLAGCSAGAMMLGAFTIRVREALAGNTPGWAPAMGVLRNLAVLPHFDRMRGFVSGEVFHNIIHTAPHGVAVAGVDEDTALVQINGAWQIMGRQKVSLFDADGNAHTFAAGDVVPTRLTTRLSS
jgi:cyanophycinase-like exopeptidase